MRVHVFVSLFTILACATAIAAVPVPPEAASELNWTRRPVPFSHAAHFAGLGVQNDPSGACISCHHPVNGEAVYATCASKGCHDNLNQKDISVHSYYLATHKKETERYFSCVSCHEKQAGEELDRRKGLAGCKGSVCHS